MFKFIFRTIKNIIRIVILLVLVAAGVFAYARLVEPYMLETVHVELDGPEITSEEPLKIVLFGDTHLGFDYDLEDFDKVIDAINAEAPDIIVFTGDLIDNLNTFTGDTSEVEAALREISATYGKYAVHGNHDYTLSANDLYTEIMEAGGFEVLINENLYIPELNMNVFGITDNLIGHGDISILSAAGPYTYNLVLCHEPDVFAATDEYNVSLMLSGHTHGGQVNIPFYTKDFLPPLGAIYVNGEYTSGDNTLYVTKGIGTTKLPLRFMAKPEIVSITIY